MMPWVMSMATDVEVPAAMEPIVSSRMPGTT